MLVLLIARDPKPARLPADSLTAPAGLMTYLGGVYYCYSRAFNSLTGGWELCQAIRIERDVRGWGRQIFNLIWQTHVSLELGFPYTS